MPLMADTYPASYPPWLKNLLNTIGTSPITGANFRGMAPDEPVVPTLEPELKSIGKRISDLLDTTFTVNRPGSKLPQRMNLGNWDARSGEMKLFGTTPSAPELNATPADLDKLINAGHVGIEQPPEPAVARIRKLLAAKLP